MDLRDYLAQLANSGELRSIRAKVDPDLELAALCRREFAGEKGTALLFEQLAENRFRATANLFGSAVRMAKILRSGGAGDFAAKLRDGLKEHRGVANQRLVKMAGTHPLLPYAGEAKWCRQSTATLFDLPAIRSWPQEVKPYLTLPLVISRDPQTGMPNLGLYRAQVISESQVALNFPPGGGAGAHLKTAAELGESLSVALVFGSDPALYWLAAAPLPAECNDFGLFTILFDEEVPLSLGNTQELLIPADAEFVVEGFVKPGKTCVEGPFGNHTGNYVSREDCPVMEITSIAWREQAIMPLTVVGPPPSENVYLGRVNEILIRELLRIDFPEIIALRMPELTIFHGAALLQVATADLKTGRDLIERLWENSPLQRSRLLLLFDADIDLASSEQAYWRLLNQLDSGRFRWRGKQLAIDATGIDPQRLVVEDRETAERITRRRKEDEY